MDTTMIPKTLLVLLLVYFSSDFSHGERDKKFFQKDYTYIEAVDSYYKIHKTPRTFSKAKQMCVLEGSSLFYPENEDEANAVVAYLDEVYRTVDWGVFLGLTDLETEGEFKTIDGKPISDVYKKWRTGEPNNDKYYSEEDCVQLYRQGYMNDVSCYIMSPFICKKKDYTYIKALDSYYKIHTVRRTFAEAKRMCVLEGAHLFYPKNDDEANAVIGFWNRAQPSEDWLLVGMPDLKTEGVFETTEGQLSNDVYNRWQIGEPNNMDGAEDCVQLSRQGHVNDIPCGNKYSFICKRPQPSQWNYDCNMADYTFSQDTGKCYKVHTATPLTWIEANTVCRAELSYLAVINNKTEAEYLANLSESTPKRRVGGTYQRGMYHLGFHNMFNEGWQTLKGTPISVDADAWWDKYTPTGDESEQCGSMVVNGLLNNINCDTKSFFICEHEAPCGKSSLDTCYE